MNRHFTRAQRGQNSKKIEEICNRMTADPGRRAIIIAAHFDSSRQAISTHLVLLTECEVLKPQQQGREVHYHLNAEKLRTLKRGWRI